MLVAQVGRFLPAVARSTVSRTPLTLRAMSSVRRHLHPLTWFAMVVMLAFALLQTVALARVMPGGAWTEVCTVEGMKMVSLDTGETAPSDPSGHLGHCPLCHLVGDGSLALLPAQPAWALAPLGQAAPAAFLHAPRTLFAWAPAQARAPPVLLA